MTTLLPFQPDAMTPAQLAAVSCLARYSGRYIRHLGEAGLMSSSVVTSMHAVRGCFRYVHIDGLIESDPAVYVAACTHR